MLPTWVITWLIGLTIGALLGILVARESAKTEALPGGWISALTHYLACALIMANAPTALLTTIFLGSGGFLTRLGVSVALVFTNLGVAAICLLLYAVKVRSIRVKI